MYIKALQLQNFRNYKDLNILLNPSLNVFVGDNAQGKTNILESIYLCATGRSHRTLKDSEVIRWDNQASHIKAIIQKRNIKNEIDLYFSTQRKKAAAINRLPIQKLSELFGVLNVVMFSPEDLQLIKKSPKERRRFMDIEICQFDRIYYYALQQYYKILKQRNKVLKQQTTHDPYEMIEIWDKQLVQYGIQIIKKREEFINSITEIAQTIHDDISGKRELLEIEYKPNVLDSQFEEKLNHMRRRDIINRTTGVGPHRDDIQFLVNGADVKTYGSQGQQRTVVLSMKLAELQMMQQATGETPILLLDDVLSELDHNRQQFLFSYIQNVQALITCTGIEKSIWDLEQIGNLFQVTGGSIEPLPCN